jgi:hypothetical protein
VCTAAKFYLHIFLFIYVDAHALFGPFLPLDPHSASLPGKAVLPLSLILLKRRQKINALKKDKAFLLVEIRIAIQRFLALLLCKNVLQPKLIHLYLTVLCIFVRNQKR